MVPIFPEILPHLRDVFEAAPAGAVNVIGRYREGSNLNPQLRRIILRAGLTPWPKTWHNLRASRQTELASTFPLHTVCAWIGNTKAIAAGHYLQVTDADWRRAVGMAEGETPSKPGEKGADAAVKGGAKSGARAVQKAAQHTAAWHRNETQCTQKTSENTGVLRMHASACDSLLVDSMGRRGLEPRTLRE